MSTLPAVYDLISRGRFREASEALRSRSPSEKDHLEIDVLRAFLHERLGSHSDARPLADRLLRSQQTSLTQKSLLEQALGAIDLEIGKFEAARTHFQRAVTLALESGDIRRVCSSQLRLWELLCDYEGADAAAPLLREVRDNTLRAGVPTLAAALHAYVGESEAKRGLTETARWHTQIALNILRKHENLWLEAVAENTLMAISLMRSDYRTALAHGLRAVSLAERSGAAAAMRACLGNLGNTFFLRGQFDEAKRHLEQARSHLGLAGENANANTDSLARISLAEGDISRCAELLDQIEAAIRRPDDRVRFAYRFGRLTRAQLLLRSNQPNLALQVIDETLALAQSVKDRRLAALARAVRGEVLISLGLVSAAAEQVAVLGEQFGGSDVDVYGHYLRLCSVTAAAAGDAAGCLSHYLTAKRVYSNIGDVRGITELTAGVEPALSRLGSSGTSSSPEVQRARDVLTSVATILLFPDRPEIVAGEVHNALQLAGAFPAGSARCMDARRREDLAPAATDAGSGDVTRVFQVADRSLEIRLDTTADTGAIAATNALTSVVAAAVSVAAHQSGRNAEAAIWPHNGDAGRIDSVVTRGQMADLLSLAHRVARPNVTVLITGESGTGKEILARAVHNFSPRAARPFIPFNCTAVPRDLLEGQMFGHRRGAFTGADRDHPGIIRAAAEGTLFLDEIGELGLDLQPKLLRFLESGEVFPLGETQPLKVDVRIIAATNRDLDQLVADGSFREDLYYRLNVVRLRVPPLRERRDEIPALAEHFVRVAAQEYEKGDVRISPDTLEYLLLFRWPGNIRQLANELRRIVIMAERNAVINPEDLSTFVTTGTIKPAPPGVQAPQPTELVVRMDQPLAQATAHLEREMLAYALKQAGGRLEEAASVLGLSRKGLYLKRQRLGLN